ARVAGAADNTADMNPCPPLDDLRRLLADQLIGPEAEVVERHLETCADCQPKLDELTTPPTGGTFLRRLQQQPPAAALLVPQRPRTETGAGDPSVRMNVVPRSGLAPQTAREVQRVLQKRLLFIAAVCWIASAIYA